MFTKKICFKIKESFLLSIIFIFFIMFISNVLFADAGANFAEGPAMKVNRMAFHQVSFADGKVILFGGHGTNFTSLNTAEVWNPTTNSFTTLTMNYTHDSPAFAKLLDGRYLIAGGSSDLGVPAYANAEIFDPANNTFTPTGSMVRFRASSGAATLTSGKVLLAGAWYNHNDAYSYGELYDPVSGTFTATGALNTPRSSNYVFPTGDGKAVVFGGFQYTTGNPSYEQVELYDPVSNNFTVLQNSLFPGETGWYAYNPNNADIESVRLNNGKYLFKAYNSSGEHTLGTFDPVTKTFAKVVTIPSLPANTSVSFFSPVLNKTLNTVYLLGIVAGTDPAQLRLYTIDLASGTLTAPSGSYTLPNNYYPDSAGISFLQNGSILLAGGHSQIGYNTNFSPINNTLFITPIPILFADNFENGSTLDAAKWPSISGSSVTQVGGDLKIEQAQTDNGGKIVSMAIPIENVSELIVSKKIMAHYANNYFDGYMQLYFGQGAYFATNTSLSTVTASYTNYAYSNSTERVVTGFHLGKYPGHFIQDIPTITPLWDTWFDEEVHYFTKTGVAEYYINEVKKATVQLDVLSQSATHMKIEMGSWGWYTGHYLQIKDISVRANTNSTSSTTTYKITASAGADGTISPSGDVSVNSGSDTTFTISPNNGYIVSDVKVDNVSQGAIDTYTFSNITSDHTIEAIFKLDTVVYDVLFSDNFDNGNTPDPVKWPSIKGSSVTQANTELLIEQAATDNGGKILSMAIPISDVDKLIITKRALVHFANDYFDGCMQLLFGQGANFTGESPLSTVTASYTNYIYSNSTERAVTGFHLGRYPGHFIQDIPTITPIWDNWFDEEIQYFTKTGVAEYYLDGIKVATVQLDALSANATHMRIEMESWGWYTGHYMKIENISVRASSTATTNTITATTGTGGTISPSGNLPVSHGANQTFTITPYTGYIISDVKVDNVSQGTINTYTFSNVVSDHTIEVSFVISTHTITASAGNGGNIAPSGNITVSHGANQTFNISANNGFHIMDVTVDGFSIGAMATYTFNNVVLSHTIDATFANNSTGGTDTHTDTNTGGGGKKGCVITTITNNSTKNKLNEVKDKFMITNSAGNFIINFYYTISPKIINLIK